MGEPVVLRMVNRLPDDHVGFGVPRTTVHLHGGHVEARSDGFPEDIDGERFVFGPGEHFDYCYAMQDVGFARGQPLPEERPATLWYHDHLLDFTGPNVYRGLAGFYLVLDELDCGDETKGLRLPSGEFDHGLVVQDKLIAPDGSLVYLPGSFDGFLGDRFLVNGAIQPYLEVQRRKYRFRILNGSNARFYYLSLTDASGDVHPFDRIGNAGGLYSRTIRDLDHVFLSNAERADIVVDFSKHPAGTELFLEDLLDQKDGRGPGGHFDDPDLVDTGRGHQVMKFIVWGPSVSDPSEVPDSLCPMQPVPQSELDAAVRREFVFERTNGAWAINHQFIDIDKPIVSPPLEQPQIWTLKNGGGGWWHPIHVHLEYMRVLSRNGQLPQLDERDGMARKDTINLGPTDEVEVFIKFRDFKGSTVFHCHNLEHEDHFMMGRIDVV